MSSENSLKHATHLVLHQDTQREERTQRKTFLFIFSLLFSLFLPVVYILTSMACVPLLIIWAYVLFTSSFTDIFLTSFSNVHSKLNLGFQMTHFCIFHKFNSRIFVFCDISKNYKYLYVIYIYIYCS